MTMAQIITQVPEWLTLISLAVTSLCVTATAVAKITATKVDDEAVSKFTAFVLKAVAFLPTFGVNPRTKKLEETIKELEAHIAATEPVTTPVTETKDVTEKAS